MKSSAPYLFLLSVVLSCSSSWAGPITETSTAKPTVYMIRHGEKSKDSHDHGLNEDGVRRAECLRILFGEESEYDVGYIMSQKFEKNGKFRRPYDTVLPLATDLGQDIDTSCGRNEASCVARKVKEFKGSGDILISWRHGKMRKIAKKLGVKNPPEYPEDRNDLIWEIPYPYTTITDVRSEACPGLDVPAELVVQQLF